MASVASTPVDRSKLDMTTNQFPLIGGPLLPAGADMRRITRHDVAHHNATFLL